MPKIQIHKVIIISVLLAFAFSFGKINTQVSKSIAIDLTGTVNPSNVSALVIFPTTHRQVIHTPLQYFNNIYDIKIKTNHPNSNSTDYRHEKCKYGTKNQEQIIGNYASLQENSVGLQYIEGALVKSAKNPRMGKIYLLTNRNTFLIYQTTQSMHDKALLRPIKQFQSLLQCSDESVQKRCQLIAPPTYSEQTEHADIYLLRNKRLTHLFFDQENNKVQIKNMTFTGPNGSVDSTMEIQKVIFKNNKQMFVLTRTMAIKIMIQSQSVVILYNVQSEQNQGEQVIQKQFVDMSIDEKKCYSQNDKCSMVILQRKNGIIYIEDVNNVSRIVKTPTEFSYAFEKVSLYSNTILITLKIRHKNFLAQVFVDELQKNEPAVLNLNKYYDRFARFNQVHMIDQNFAVLASSFRFDIFGHSINRKSSLRNFYEAYGLFRKSSQYIVEILPVSSSADIPIKMSLQDPLDTNQPVEQQSNQDQRRVKRPQKAQGISLLVLQFNKFTIITVSNFNQWIINCFSEQEEQTQIQVQYKGTCRNSTFPAKTHYCVFNETYDLRFVRINKQVIEQNTNRHHVLWVAAGSILACLAVIFALCFKRLKALEKILRQKWQKHRERSSQGATDEKFES